MPIHYTGAAAAVPYKCNLTIAGTWANNDTVTVTIDSHDLVIDIGTTAITTADIADKVYRAFNAGTFDDNLEDDEVRNTGGGQIPQFGGLEASFSGSVVSFWGPAGVPYALTFSKSSTSGTVAASTVQSATGPSFWDNVENWSTGALPVNGDTIWLDHRCGGRSVSHGLPNGSLQPAAVHMTQGFTGILGLPAVNNYTGRPYPEYRARYAVFDDQSEATTPTYYIGEKDGAGTGPRLVNIEQEDIKSKWVIHNTGTAISGERAAVNIELAATIDNSVAITRGTIAIAERPADNTQLEILFVQGGASCFLGAAVPFASGATININGGELYSLATITESITLRDATSHLLGGASNVLEVYGGICYYSVSALVQPTDINQSGVINFEGCTTQCGMANADPWVCFAGAVIWDRTGVATPYPVITCPNGIETVTFHLGGGAKVQPAGT